MGMIVHLCIFFGRSGQRELEVDRRAASGTPSAQVRTVALVQWGSRGPHATRQANVRNCYRVSYADSYYYLTSRHGTRHEPRASSTSDIAT